MIPKTFKKFLELLRLTRQAVQPEDYQKDPLRPLSQSYFRELAKRLGLARGEYKIRYNPGGWAVQGDTSLYSAGLYVQFSPDLSFGLLYRQSDGIQDCGARHTNRWIPWDDLGDWDKVVPRLKALMPLAKTP